MPEFMQMFLHISTINRCLYLYQYSSGSGSLNVLQMRL